MSTLQQRFITDTLETDINTSPVLGPHDSIVIVTVSNVRTDQSKPSLINLVRFEVILVTSLVI